MQVTGFLSQTGYPGSGHIQRPALFPLFAFHVIAPLAQPLFDVAGFLSEQKSQKHGYCAATARVGKANTVTPHRQDNGLRLSPFVVLYRYRPIIEKIYHLLA